MKDLIFKISFYALLFAMIVTGVYFIVHNATWLVGDDSACIVHTGWGNYYSLSDYTIPETGRFYPLSFVLYNILPLIGATSMHAHFSLHAIVFSLMLLCMCIVSRNSIQVKKFGIWEYSIILAIVAICWARSYRYFLSTEWATWISYFTIIVWSLCTWYVHERQSVMAAIVGVLLMLFFCFSGEVNSSIPFAYGVCQIVLRWKNSTRLERAYFIGVFSTSLLFLVLYFFIIYLHLGDNVYDASHGENIALWKIILKMFIAQKPFWLGLSILIVRGWQIIKQKASVEWWDTLILAGFAYAGGCAVMHLHHTVYYWSAALCMLPAIIHYLYEWIGGKWTAIIMLIMATVMCHRLPNVIQNNQEDRIASIKMQHVLKEHIESGESVYYYAPYVESDGSNAYEWRKQKEDCLPAYIGDAINNHQYTFTAITEFGNLPGIYILPCENEKLVPGKNDAIIEAGKVVFKGGYGNLTLVEILQ